MRTRLTHVQSIVTTVLLTGMLCASSLTAHAAANPQINYQGKLTDAANVAVEDGVYNMRFWLLTDDSIATTSALWTEELTGGDAVQVTNGVFSIMLGSTTPLTSVDFNQTLYLGVEIGGIGSPDWDGEMSPRKILGTVPAAFVARIADDALAVGGVASTSLLRSDADDTATGLVTFDGGLTSSATTTLSGAAGGFLRTDGSGVVSTSTITEADISDFGDYLTVTGNLGDLDDVSAARTNLGATTVGANLFMLTNPSAERYLRINADNSVSARTASEFRGDIGAAASSHTHAAGDITSGILTVPYGGTGVDTVTAGRILFGAGTSPLASSANLFWDSGNSRLGIGTASPATQLTVIGSSVHGLQLGQDTSNTNNSSRLFFTGSNTYAMYNLGGKLTFTTGATIGSTSGTARMTLDSSGNLGIGTASPSELLHVAGDVRIEGGLYDGANSVGTSGYLLSSTGTGTAWAPQSGLSIGWSQLTSVPSTFTPSAHNHDAGDVTTGTFHVDRIPSLDTSKLTSGTLGVARGGTGLASVTAGHLLFGNGTSALATSSALFWDSAESRLGIGTDTPLTTLDVRGPIGVFRDGIVGTGILDEEYSGIESLTSIFQIDAANTYGMAYVGAGNNQYSVWQEYIKTRSTDGSTNAIVQDGDELGRFNFHGDDGSWLRTAAEIRVSVDGTPGSSDMPGRISFYTTPDGSSTPLQRLTIKNSGNVGIGTTTPSHLLTVAGNSLFGGDITIGHDGGINGGSRSLSFVGLGDGADVVQSAYLQLDSYGWEGMQMLDVYVGDMVSARFSQAGIQTNSLHFANASSPAIKWHNESVGLTIRNGYNQTSGLLLNVANLDVTQFAIGHDGKVGIGTETPEARLTVAGAGDSVVNIGDYFGAGYGAISLNGTANGTDYHFLSGNTSTDNSLYINRVSGGGIHFREGGGTTQMLLSSGGNLGIGTSTPDAKLSLYNVGLTGAVNGGISQYLQFVNSTGSAVYYGDNTYIVNAPTAASTLVGKMIRVEDTSSYANTVRGLEVQAHRGTNTLGENTALSGFARTFGVRGTTFGDAGSVFLPAGVFAETQGTTQGNAFRAYSGTITTEDLVSFYHDTSTFTGTGLEMDFGNSGGSFSAGSGAKFLNFKIAGVSKFVVNSNGVTTLGDGTTIASLRVPYGGICVDNDGSCTATTAGLIRSVTATLGNSDLAEIYFSSQELEPGEIVTLDGGLSVQRAEEGSEEDIIGVVSTKPGLLLGFDDTSLVPGETGYPIGLSGRVPIKLSTENGPIVKGDRITLSSISGIGMKAIDTQSRVVGIALEDWNGERAYSEGYLNQFGDDLIDEAVTPEQEVDVQKDGCYYGAGGALGDTPCAPTQVETSAPETILLPTREESLALLEEEDAARRTTPDGDDVWVGQAIMFIELSWYQNATTSTMLAELLSPDVVENGDGVETLWDRLKALAQNFVDGVLAVTGLKADRIETQELCIDNVCVTGDQLRALLNGSGVTPSSSSDDTADNEDEETPADNPPETNEEDTETVPEDEESEVENVPEVSEDATPEEDEVVVDIETEEEGDTDETESEDTEEDETSPDVESDVGEPSDAAE